MKKILVIEDEAALAEALKYTLGKEGYDVDIVLDGAEGLERFRTHGADLVLLDLMLPGMDGLEVCRRIRQDSAVPILMLTAKDSDTDEVVGLELGADDYVTKPFNTRTLVTRIKALLRRVEERREEGGRRQGTLRCGPLVMDLERHEVSLEGEPVALTPTEYGLLLAFMRRPGRALTREFLLAQVWEDFYGSPKTLDVHIRHLRKKIEEDPSNPTLITTIRGAGFRLESGGETTR
ncbi:MAG: response regulator transcription factor [Actinomycetota bacterium]